MGKFLSQFKIDGKINNDHKKFMRIFGLTIIAFDWYDYVCTDDAQRIMSQIARKWELFEYKITTIYSNYMGIWLFNNSCHLDINNSQLPIKNWISTCAYMWGLSGIQLRIALIMINIVNFMLWLNQTFTFQRNKKKCEKIHESISMYIILTHVFSRCK